MRPFLLRASLCCLLCFGTGCCQVEAVHVLHPYGVSDTGAYRIKMSNLAFAFLSGEEKEYNNFIKSLRKFSKPQVTKIGDEQTAIEDNTGTAQMDGFYDTHSCQQTGNIIIKKFYSCHYSFEIPKDVRDTGKDWSVDWKVVVPSNMQIVKSNATQTRHVSENNTTELIWTLDQHDPTATKVDYTIITSN